MAISSFKQFVRIQNWWVPKIAPLLAVGYAQLLLAPAPVAQSLVRLAAAVLALCGVGAYGHVINDLFDLEEDRRSGKPNAFQHRPASQRLLAVALCLTVVVTPAVVCRFGWSSLLLLLTNCLLPTVYSIPPVRLKERGLWGVVCDSFGAHVVPSAFMLSVFAGLSSPDAGMTVYDESLLLTWAFLTGLKGILHHQLHDRQNDLASGTRTFLTESDDRRVNALMRYVLWPLEALAFCGLVLMLRTVSPLLVVAFLGYVLVELAKCSLGWEFRFDQDRRYSTANLPLTNNYFYESWFPLSLAFDLTRGNIAYAILPLLQVVFFFQPLREQWREFCSVLTASLTRWTQWRNFLRWGWHFDLDTNCRGVIEGGRVRGAIRVIPEISGSRPEQISLWREVRQIRAGTHYRLTFLARATESRAASCGVSMNEPPWTSVGLVQSLQLANRWQAFHFEFLASDDQSSARLFFLLGGNPAPIELANLEFRSVDHPCRLDCGPGCRARRRRRRKAASTRVLVQHSDGQPAQIRLHFAGFKVSAGAVYRVAFRARADRRRSIRLTMAQAREPWHWLGLHQESQLNEQWRTIVADFIAKEPAADAAISFDLGSCDGRIEVSDPMLHSNVPGGPVILERHGDGLADLIVGADPATLRIVIHHAGELPWHVKLVCGRHHFVKGASYQVKFQARADSPRRIQFGAVQNHSPWNNLGCYRDVELATDWRSFKANFIAEPENDDGCLFLAVGAEPADVEFRGLELIETRADGKNRP